jgi:hypothetical protein
MPFQKVTFILNAGRQGWTYTFYRQDADPKTAVRNCTGLKGALSNCMGIGSMVEAVRATNMDEPQVSVLREFAVPAMPSPPDPLWARDQAAAGLLYRLTSAQGYHRPLILRCPPDSWIQYSTNLNVSAQGAKQAVNVGIVRDYLTDGTWFLNVIDKSSLAVNEQKITAVATVPGNPNQTLITAPGHSILPTELFRIAKMNGVGWTTLRGTYRCRGLIGQEIIIDHVPADPLEYLGGGVTREINMIYDEIAFLTGQGRAITHKTGRAFFVPRGRRAAQKTK